MASFDVESLFTNVPTTEIIDLIIEMIPADGLTTNGYIRGFEVTRPELKDLLIMCTQKSHFQFNGVFYEQKDGVAIGLPLGPLFANVFMSNFERKHIKELKERELRKWLR